LDVYTDATKRNNENRVLSTVATAIGRLIGHVIGALLVVVFYLWSDAINQALQRDRRPADQPRSASSRWVCPTADSTAYNEL
jgi:hypothetical protein